MVLHVLERAKKSRSLDDVVVLTDDQRIFDIVTATGHSVVMTSPDCMNGTERIAEYMASCAEGDVFVNMQGDEVLLDARHVDQLVDAFLKSEQPEMGTLAHWVSDPEVLSSPTTAKVVTDRDGYALYFSRGCIPTTQSGILPQRALVHIGVYIYGRDTLARLSSLEPTPLENSEKLEQLRALENGIKIGVTIVDGYQSLSVDTPEDLRQAQKLFAT